MRNKNMYKTSLRIKEELADWFATQSAVAATITDVTTHSITILHEGRAIELVAHTGAGLDADISVEAEALLSVIAKVDTDQTVRIGSGQWTFNAEPDAQRLIFSEREEFA